MRWAQIPDFPRYSVSDQGLVRNDETDRIMRRFHTGNQRVSVGLMRDKRQYTRAVSHLVAEAFLPPPHNHYFDTVVQLDTDRENCHFENLVWRPRWFSIKYTTQFRMEFETYPPIRDRNTREEFESVWDVVPLRGLLYLDVVRATHEMTYVFPTMDFFEWIE